MSFESRFPLKMKKTAYAVFFVLYLAKIRFARATPHSPFRGWGCKINSREIAHEHREFESRFPLKMKKTALSFLFCTLITHRYKLADIEAAYHLFENKLDGVIKVAIEP